MSIFFVHKKTSFFKIVIGAFVAIFLSVAAQPVFAQSVSFSLDAEPVVFLASKDTKRLGLKTGPDSIVELWPDDGGDYRYLIFSGYSYKYGRGTFKVKFNRDLSSLYGGAADEVWPVLQPAINEKNPLKSGKGSFDFNYAGGGTLYKCGNGKILYAYHGENQTDARGVRHWGPKPGWSGIGLATWDPVANNFIRDRQIAGLNQSNYWRKGKGGEAGTNQTAPSAGMGSLTPSPDGKFLYLLYNDRTDQPDSEFERPCVDSACPVLARADLREVCDNAGTSAQVSFRKYFRGSFAEPSVYDAEKSKDIGSGTGGRFSAAYGKDGGTETAANLTYVASRKIWIQSSVLQPENVIGIRYSSDLRTWSPIVKVRGPTQKGARMFYARVLDISSTSAASELRLTWLEKIAKSWDAAFLMGQRLQVDAR